MADGPGRRASWWQTALVWFFALVALLPFVQMLWTAQRPRERVDAAYNYLLNRMPGHEVRQKIEVKPRPLRVAAINSVIVSVTASAVCVVLSAMAGYAFAKRRFAGKAALFDLVLASMALPPALLMMPLFRLSVQLHIYDTLLALILPFCVTGFGIFYMRYVISAVPDERLESARLDGLSEGGVLFRIVLPSVWPSLATLAVLQFIANWGLFVVPNALVASPGNYTMGILIGRIMADFRGLMWNDIMIVVIAAVIPVLVVFAVFNRWVLSGATAIGDDRGG